MRVLYFDAPAGGLDSNADVVADFQANASASSPVAADRLRFDGRGGRTLVVVYDDDDGAATQTSLDALAAAVETVYGVTHDRTVTR